MDVGEIKGMLEDYDDSLPARVFFEAEDKDDQNEMLWDLATGEANIVDFEYDQGTGTLIIGLGRKEV